MIYDCFVMLVTQHNIAIRSMDKVLQHFKIDWSSCIRLTRSFESSLSGRRSKGKGRGIGASKSPSPSPFNARWLFRQRLTERTRRGEALCTQALLKLVKVNV